MDDALWVLIGGSLVLYLLVGPALGIAAFAGSRRAQRQVELLSASLQRLNGELAALRRQSAPETPPSEAEAARPVEPEAPLQTEPAPQTRGPELSAGPETSPAPAQMGDASAAAAASRPRLGIEQWLT